MKKITVSFLSISVLLLAACNEEEERSVDFYKNNDAERTAKIEQCKKDGVKTDSSRMANCMNANKAQNIKAAENPHQVTPEFTGTGRWQ